MKIGLIVSGNERISNELDEFENRFITLASEILGIKTGISEVDGSSQIKDFHDGLLPGGLDLLTYVTGVFLRRYNRNRSAFVCSLYKQIVTHKIYSRIGEIGQVGKESLSDTSKTQLKRSIENLYIF